jgi:urease accessory protein
MAMNSQLTLRIARRGDVSRLASVYFTPPFKIADITEDKQGPFLHLMLQYASPGVLDGDEQTIDITLEAKSRLHLHTPAYSRLFWMKEGACQRMTVHVGKNACFCWLPHPCVPHARSVFRGRNYIYLDKDAQLLWGEVLTCGRKGSGEQFTLSSYHVRTEVHINGRLALLENVCLRPSVIPVGSMGQLEEFTHQASLLCVHEAMSPEMHDRIGSFLSHQAGIAYGHTEGPAGSLVIRILGDKAEPLYNMLKTIQTMIYEC